MKRHVAVLAIVLLVPLVSSCCTLLWVSGSGRIITEERSVPTFHSVDFRGSGKLTVTQGDPQRLVVTTDDNIMPILRTTVRNNVLIISLEPGIRHITKLEVDVVMERIRGLSLSGSGIITGTNRIRSDSLGLSISGSGNALLDIVAKDVNVRLSGSGDLTLNLDAGTLTSDISGSGKLFLSGQAATHDYHSSGSGRLRAFDLITDNTSVRISGSGSCEVRVSEHLDIRTSGSGHVRYRGNPRIESKISGSGSVRSAD